MLPGIKRFIWAMFWLAILMQSPAIVAQRDQTLLPMATRRVDHANWALGMYWWVSDHEVLVFRDLDEFYHGKLFRLDITTDKQTFLKALTDQYCAEESYPMAIKVSPDGQWMLWPTESSYRGATLDGSRHFEVVVELGGQTNGPPRRNTFCWLADSRHWVEFVSGPNGKLTHAVVHSVDPSEAARTFSIPEESPAARLGAAALGYGGNAGPGSSDAEHLIAALRWYKASPEQELAELDFHNGVLKTRLLPLTMPKGLHFEGAVFAPKGDRVAWIVKTPPALQGQPERPSRVSIWVSRPDGSEMRQIGHSAADGKGKPGHVRWLPDGKTLSFISEDTLWTISVEGAPTHPGSEERR